MELNLPNIIMITSISGLAYGVIEYLKKLLGNQPDRKHEKNLQNIQSENQRALQVESYFREISGENLEKTFRDWTSLLVDMKKRTESYSNAEGEEHFKQSTINILMYGSDKTVKIYSLMRQNIYKSNNVTSDETKVHLNRKTLIYMAAIISSLKFDFTGYKNSIKDILEANISDINTLENQNKFNVVIKEVEESIKKL